MAPPDEETRSNHADAGEDDDRYEGGVGSGAAGRDLRNTLDRTSAVTTVASGAIYSLEVLRPLPSEVFEGTVIAANLSYEVPGDWLICVTYDDDSSRATSSSSSFSSPTSSLSRPECGLPGSPLSPWQHTFPKRHSDELAEGAHRFAAWFHRRRVVVFHWTSDTDPLSSVTFIFPFSERWECVWLTPTHI